MNSILPDSFIRGIRFSTGVFCFFFSRHVAFAQDDTTHSVDNWDFSTQPGADSKPVLVLRGHIREGWRLYSTTMADSLPNSRVTLDSTAGATIQDIEEKGQLRTQKEPLFCNAVTRSFAGDAQWLGHLQPAAFASPAGDLEGALTFITKRSASRSKGIANAFLYGLFIFLIYVLISVPFYFLKANNANILNNIATNVWLNLFFAAVFLAFALSFFGLFEITLPSSISNSVDTKSNISSVGGIFFMALTLAVVSFSCTGPILGTFVVSALGPNGGPVQLTVVLAGFGLALGLPFALFALFPSWLQTLPRSGSWMNTVKIVFGFLELALFIKYFSNADLVTHWGLLKRETFFAFWILISIALALYLFGVIKFHHDPPPDKLGNARISFTVVFLTFALSMVPVLTNTKNANVSLISGFPPPLSYSLYTADEGKGVEANVINDYDKALALAKQQHKPLLIDFTGWACVNCRKMEENVWTKVEVKDKIKQNFILVSLYVDDRKVLPDDQQFLFTTGDGSKKEIRTIGDKFATFQSENFKNASQPLYVVISPDEKLMNFPVGYTPNAKEYAAWLQCGLEAYKKQN